VVLVEVVVEEPNLKREGELLALHDIELNFFGTKTLFVPKGDVFFEAH